MLDLTLGNPLAFPAGRAPGFDPTHVAAQGCVAGKGFSGVSVGGNFINLLNGKPGTLAGSPTSAVQNTGPATFYSGATDATSFTVASGTPSAFTAACITTFASVTGGFQSIFFQAGGGQGYPLILVSGGNFGSYYAGGISSTFVPTAGVPYFMASSLVFGGASNFLVLNLSTGQLFTHSLANAASNSAITSLGVGTQAGNATHHYTAGAMFTPSFMSILALLQWAQSPWDFWYPPQNDLILAYG